MRPRLPAREEAAFGHRILTTIKRTLPQANLFRAPDGKHIRRLRQHAAPPAASAL